MTDPLLPPSLIGAVEPIPPQAHGLFGSRLPQAVAYVELLATVGVERGLIGPRERPRLWSRHVLNCAAIAPALPEGSVRVVDVGSGAGLPGIPLMLARPDLRMTLLEPLARRATFLVEALGRLDLHAEVLRGRAEEVAEQRWDVAVARAVAPLERLLALASRLVQAGGMLLAVKGRTAAAELDAAAGEIRRSSTRPAEILTLGDAEAGATVVRVFLDRTRPRGKAAR